MQFEMEFCVSFSHECDREILEKVDSNFWHYYAVKRYRHGSHLYLSSLWQFRGHEMIDLQWNAVALFGGVNPSILSERKVLVLWEEIGDSSLMFEWRESCFGPFVFQKCSIECDFSPQLVNLWSIQSWLKASSESLSFSDFFSTLSELRPFLNLGLILVIGRAILPFSVHLLRKLLKLEMQNKFSKFASEED